MRLLTLFLLALGIAGCGAKTEPVTTTSSSATETEPQPDPSRMGAHTGPVAAAGETVITAHEADAQESLAAAIATAKGTDKSVFVHVGGPG